MRIKKTALAAGVVAGILSILPPVVTLALTPEQVAFIAERFTVRISGPASGTGVIINKNGNTYTVLANFHTFDSLSGEGRTLKDWMYRVTTADGKTHSVINNVRIPNLDLARFNFRSNEKYRVVQIGDSDKLVRGRRVYVNGFPWEKEITFLPTQITRILTKQIELGYALVYQIGAFSGMSGSPILDEDGKLVGIHSKADVLGDPDLKDTEEYGIPINAYKSSPIYFNNAEFYFNKAYNLSQAGDNQGAMVNYTIAIQIQPTYTYAYNNRGLARSNLGDNQGAIDDYNQAIKLDPNYALAYYNRGLARYNLGDNQGAIDDYTQAIKLDPNYAYAYNNRGIARRQLGDKQGAIDDYTQAIKLDPNNALAYNNRGIARRNLGDNQGAIDDYTQAIKLDPNYAHAYNNRGNARYNLGDNQGAIDDLQKAADLYQKQGKENDYRYALNMIRVIRR
ncbi:MAG: tetratricopeptide repeat-containing serine protease family protein [Cylindrospermopsis raciborskii]|uniref:tetratricopeptide repeat-containing S1 family peptidase n=1 Tax=Cylindrospermopsis raciborskii TaxID=77022 RepID=UPI003D0B5122